MNSRQPYPEGSSPATSPPQRRILPHKFRGPTPRARRPRARRRAAERPSPPAHPPGGARLLKVSESRPPRSRPRRLSAEAIVGGRPRRSPWRVGTPVAQVREAMAAAAIVRNRGPQHHKAAVRLAGRGSLIGWVLACASCPNHEAVEAEDLRGVGGPLQRARRGPASDTAGCVAAIAASPVLLPPDCRIPEQMRLANPFCRFSSWPRQHPRPEVDGIPLIRPNAAPN